MPPLFPYVALVVLVNILVLLLSSTSAPLLAQADDSLLTEVRSLDINDVGVVNPAGLAYSPEANLFFVLESSPITETAIVMMTPFEE
jgi:hypothetical protein